MSKADVTEKYKNMIEAFECDFVLVRDGRRKLSSLQQNIDDKDEDLLKDIELLEELSFNLRHGKLKIIEIEEQDIDIQDIEELYELTHIDDYNEEGNCLRMKINEVLKAVKQIDREMNKSKQDNLKVVIDGIDTDKIIEETRKEINREEK